MAKALNLKINRKKVEIDTALFMLEEETDINACSVNELRDLLLSRIANTTIKHHAAPCKPKKASLLVWYTRFIEQKAQINRRTAQIYRDSLNRILAWLGEEQLASVSLDDIKYRWLEDYQNFLAQTCCLNTISIHMRNLRAVINYAIDNEATTNYPFRRFKIKEEPTRKRAFDVATLRKIFKHQCEEEWQQKYLDFFKLSFMLIGINPADLFGLRKVEGNRVEYKRRKTHKLYTVKVESEALEIIDKYIGDDKLLCFTENYSTDRTFYNNMNSALNRIKGQLGLKELTLYWARHSWATIAYRLGISKDVVGQALGHSQKTVTDIYIDFTTDAVDKANRQVLDYVLYNKRS